MAVTKFLILAFSFRFSCEGLLLGITNTSVTNSSTSSFDLLENLFLNERQILTQYVVSLEQKFLIQNQYFEQILNQTQEEITNITQTLASEKSKRVQLQKDYDKLMVNFYNLTVEQVALKAQNEKLTENDTNLYTKIEYLVQTIQNISDVIEKLNVTELGTGQALKQTSAKQVGFTADYPHDGPQHGTIRFSNVVTNIGDRYNSTTGKFICDIPGVYLFALLIYKTAYADSASCYLRKNNTNKVEAFSSHPLHGGFVEASASVVLHLGRGDTVDLAGCTRAATMETFTTFSGVLISPY